MTPLKWEPKKFVAVDAATNYRRNHDELNYFQG